MTITITPKPGLSTPPTSNPIGNDSWDARQKIVAAIGNLNNAVGALQAIVGPASFPAVAHEFLNSYNATNGDFTATRPSFSDISGNLASGQMPAGGFSGTVPLAKLTVGGSNGSITVVNGQITAAVDPT